MGRPSTISAVLERDLWMLRCTHPNVLLVGADEDVDEALFTLQCTFRQPVATCDATNPLALPSPRSGGTLVLKGVGDLGPASQMALHSWMEDARAGIQLISTTVQPLWPLLEAGKFFDALYYRLNLVYFDLTRRGRSEADRAHRAGRRRAPLAGSFGG
jgi:hypothetical protein